MSLAVGFAVGILSLAAARGVDVALGATVPGWQALARYGVLAGASYAAGLSLAPRALRRSTKRFAVEITSIPTATIGFLFFLVPILVVVPDSTGRWVAYVYASSILFGWVALRLGILPSREDGPTVARWAGPERVAYIPFAAAGVILLAASLICALVGLRDPTIQLANWAFGFLLLATLAAAAWLMVRQFDLAQRLGRAAAFVLPFAVVTFFPIASFVEANTQTIVERQLVTDVYPHFLSQHLRDGDILVTDGPNLRLNNIPRLGASLVVDPDANGPGFWEVLTRALESKQRVLWVTEPGHSRDTNGRLAAFLKTNGCLDAVSATSLPVQVYTLTRPFSPPRVLPPHLADRAADTFDPVRVNFGPIEMTGVRHEPRACTHDAVAVAIRWNLASKTLDPLKLSLFLRDATGRRVQTQDYYIDDAHQRQTDQWEPGTAADYVLLPIPQGTPPGTYTLGAGVYAADKPEWLQIGAAEGVKQHSNYVELGQVDLYRGRDPGADPWRSRADSNMLPANVAMQDGLVLDGYHVQGSTIIPGESLRVGLRWLATRDGLPSYVTGVALRQGETIVAEQAGAPVDGTYSTDEWKSGEFVTEWRDLRVPPDVNGEAGARLEASVIGGKSVWLADIKIVPIARTYQMPSAAVPTHASFRGVGDLVGYELQKLPATAQQPFELTLYWKSGGTSDKDFVVFAQLLSPDGRLVAQSDNRPAQGQRPTRSWLPGEIIADRHLLRFSQKDYAGDAKLIVGLYEAETGMRVPIDGTTDDHHTLPTSIQIVGQ